MKPPDSTAPRHRTDDLQGQTNGRPLTIDNDRADAMRAACGKARRAPPWDEDAHRRADSDPWDPLFDPLEQIMDLPS